MKQTHLICNSRLAELGLCAHASVQEHAFAQHNNTNEGACTSTLDRQSLSSVRCYLTFAILQGRESTMLASVQQSTTALREGVVAYRRAKYLRWPR